MADTPFHDILRQQAEGAWQAMQAHRFVRDIEADRLPREAFLRYLSFERALSKRRC